MMDVINLDAERNRRQQPDEQFRKTDDFGRPMFCFLLSYDYQDGSFSTEVWAYSEEDAQARVEAMRASLRYDGKLFSQVIL